MIFSKEGINLSFENDEILSMSILTHLKINDRAYSVVVYTGCRQGEHYYNI